MCMLLFNTKASMFHYVNYMALSIYFLSAKLILLSYK